MRVAKLLARALAVALSFAYCPAALALRPFDGTDAAVAGQGEFELELGPLQSERLGPERSRINPQVVANWGLSSDREVVLEGKVRTRQGVAEGSRTTLEDDALSLKQLHRRGSLQDEAGISIASECGVLLPEIHSDTGTGATCALIFSHRLRLATAHLNLALARTRTRSMARFTSLIVEGQTGASVRPVAELERDAQSGVATTRTALLGFIWRVNGRLSLDAAVRTGRSEGQRLNELRAGLTWATGG
jgi:hypothetical protein